MSTGSFEKTSWGWQLSQLQQQLGEWVEYQLSPFEEALPKWSPRWSLDDSWLGKLLNFLVWILLGLFLVWVGWQLWQKFSPHLYSWLVGVRNSNTSRTTTDSSDLSMAGWLVRSQQLYNQGDYREACRCLYLAMLQRLHDTSVVAHKPSRTDGEYLQLLRLSVTLMQPYETLITTHEQLCFGNGEILPDNYEQCRQAYREISNE